MTSKTDLREVSAQIEIVKQLIDNPETFDIHKILIELEAKKKLLMKYKPRDYITILKEFYPEKVTEISKKGKKPKKDEEPIIEEQLEVITEVKAIVNDKKAELEAKIAELAKLKSEIEKENMPDVVEV